MDANTIPIIVVAGPTAVGKTRVAIDLAERVHGEIIGADSRQIYRKMTIGTAKPTPDERRRVPHHLLDIRNPDEGYSAAEFARDASALAQDMLERGTLPLVVGGTGLYIHALLYGLFDGPAKDAAFRTRMQALDALYGNAYLHRQLQRVDPVTASRLHPHDTVRIVRALEVFHLTGQSISTHQAQHTRPLRTFRACFLVLNISRPLLYERIEARVDRMMADGLFQEVDHLCRQGYHANMPAMSSVGYKEILDVLQGQSDREDAIALIKRNTRHYAKRQLTWFRKYPEARWIDAANLHEACARCWEHVQAWRAALD